MADPTLCLLAEPELVFDITQVETDTQLVYMSACIALQINVSASSENFCKTVKPKLQ